MLRRRSNLPSNSCFTSNSMERMRTTTFFNVPGLFLGFTGKGSPDYDSVKSPTSPLDHQIFSNLGSSFALRSPGRSWDCSRVGLGLLDAPSNLESKNILLRIAGKPSPKSTNPSSNQTPPIFSPSVSYEKIESCISDIIYHNPNPSSNVSVMGSISAREIELSEDYTCIISHGANPKTTHMFGDCVLEKSLIDALIFQKKEDDEEGSSHWLLKSMESSSSSSLQDFLSFCCFCNKILEVGKDIYMYRGEKAFCSSGCREQAMISDGDELGIEEPAVCFPNSPRSSFLENHFV